jgi:hypothetical protein
MSEVLMTATEKNTACHHSSKALVNLSPATRQHNPADNIIYDIIFKREQNMSDFCPPLLSCSLSLSVS